MFKTQFQKLLVMQFSKTQNLFFNSKLFKIYNFRMEEAKSVNYIF